MSRKVSRRRVLKTAGAASRLTVPANRKIYTNIADVSGSLAVVDSGSLTTELSDEEIETVRIGATSAPAASTADDGDDSGDTGDDSGDVSDTSDTGDDSGDSSDTGDDSGSGA